MTLREMIDAHPDRFYAGQTWFNDEAFMDTEARADVRFPVRTEDMDANWPGLPPDSEYTAADLAALWLQYPTHEMWSHYLWSRDTDRYGQQVYLGQNGAGCEIHRHLEITERWRIPIWE